jgi:branched-subunit amino acid transport protein
MSTWTAILAAALATYLVRSSMVVAFHGRTVPPRLESALRLAGPAVLAAVIATTIVAPSGAVQAPPVAHLVALVAAGAVVRWTRKPSMALVVGLSVVGLTTAVGWS